MDLDKDNLEVVRKEVANRDKDNLVANSLALSKLALSKPPPNVSCKMQKSLSSQPLQLRELVHKDSLVKDSLVKDKDEDNRDKWPFRHKRREDCPSSKCNNWRVLTTSLHTFWDMSLLPKKHHRFRLKLHSSIAA
jgi:hypothetical protein